MCNCFRFIYIYVSHDLSTLTHPFSLFPSKLLLPLRRNATLTLKKLADLWLVYALISVPSPAFYGRLLEYKAGKRHPCPPRGRTGGARLVKTWCFYTQAPLTFLFWLLRFNAQFKLPSCWTSLSVFIFIVSCFTSPGKLGTLTWGCVSANGAFLQLGYGTASELCPRTATALLRASFSILRHSRPYVPSAFLGSHVLTVARFEKCHHIVQRSCSVLGFQGHCHLKLLLIYSLLSLETWNQFFPNVYLKYKTYWQQSFWYWDTELLQLVQESFVGQSRAVNRFFSSYYWEAKAQFRLLR